MRPALLLALFGGFVLAAPLAISPDESHAVARSENAVAPREAEPEAVSVDDRQLSPGGKLSSYHGLTPGLGNIDWDGLINQVTQTLHDTTSLTTAQVKTIVSILTDISKGKGLNGNVVGKLLTIPSSVLVKLPQILYPILVPATMGLPGVNMIVYQLLSLLQTLGGGLGLLGGLVGGLGGLLGGRDLPLDERALSGVNVDQVLSKLFSALKQTGIGEGNSNIIGNLVRNLLNGGSLGPGALGQLQSLPTSALSGVIGALNTVIWQVPGVGPLLAPLLTLLQLLLLTGLLGGVNHATAGILGGKTSPIGGLLGGIL
jgi:hypothetical protein